jgi:suppressor of ftsI
MGRFGNVLLVNGLPEATLDVERGEVVRFLLTNVAATRTFNLSFGGMPMKLVASDLSRFEREAWVESVVIAPAERYVVEVRFDEPGEVLVENRVQGIDHLNGNFFPEVGVLGSVRVAESPAPTLAHDFERLRTHREVSAEIDRLRPHFERPPVHELVLEMEAGELAFPLRPLMQLDSAFFNPVEWTGTMPMMNWAVTSRDVSWILKDPATGRRNMEIDWRFREGDLVRVRVRNERRVLHGMQHPIHFHGQRFLVLSMNGRPATNLAWKDTFLLPAGWTAELLVEMSNPGDWMIHCHISEHLESGMMATFRVDPRDGEWEGWRGFEPGRKGTRH